METVLVCEAARPELNVAALRYRFLPYTAGGRTVGVLVHSDDSIVGDDLLGFIGLHTQNILVGDGAAALRKMTDHVRDVVTENERTLHKGPHGEVCDCNCRWSIHCLGLLENY